MADEYLGKRLRLPGLDAGVAALRGLLSREIAVVDGKLFLGTDGTPAGNVEIGSSGVAPGQVSPEKFGAKGDNVTDDSPALQQALDTGLAVYLTPGKIYLVKQPLYMTVPGTSLGGGGTLRVGASWDFTQDADGGGTHLRVIFMQAANCAVQDITMDATDAPEGTAVENCFMWVTAPYCKVNNCRLIGFPKATCIFAVGGSAYFDCSGNTCIDSRALVFVRERGCTIIGNIIINAYDAAIALNGTPCKGCVVNSNMIYNEALTPLPNMIAAEEGASNWSITNNVLIGAVGGGISAVNVLGPFDGGGNLIVVKGGIISGNIISAYGVDTTTRPVSANPSSGIYIGPGYANWRIADNHLVGAPSGNSSTRMIIVAAQNGVIENNTIDGLDATGLVGINEITAAQGGLLVRNNRYIAAAGGTGGRHIVATGGNYGSVPIRLEGNEFVGGANGFNSDLAWAGISNFVLWIKDTAFNSAQAAYASASAIGDRAGYLNAGAWEFPHSIKNRTEMFANITTGPVTSGAQAFVNGDRFHTIDPVSAGCLTFVKIAGGTPFQKWGGPVA